MACFTPRANCGGPDEAIQQSLGEIQKTIRTQITAGMSLEKKMESITTSLTDLTRSVLTFQQHQLEAISKSSSIDEWDNLLRKHFEPLTSQLKLLREREVREEKCQKDMVGHNDIQLSIDCEKFQDKLLEDLSAFRATLTKDVDDKLIERLPDNLSQVLTKLSDKIDSSICWAKPSGISREQSATQLVGVEDVALPQQRDKTRSDMSPVLPAIKPQGVQRANSHQSVQRANSHRQVCEKEEGVKPPKHSKVSVESDPHQVKWKIDSAFASVFDEDTGEKTKPPYHVEDRYKTEGYCQAIARDPRFGHLTSVVVLLNAMFLGFESEHNFMFNIYEAPWQSLVISQCFATYFTTDILIRFFAFERKRDSFHDGWFRFDFILWATMVLNLWGVMPILYAINHRSQYRIPGLQALRILRLMRLARMPLLMQVFPEISIMVRALTKSLRAIASCLILVFFMMYFWAILLHTLLRRQYKMNEMLKNEYYFSFTTLGDCMWCLLMDGVLQLDNAALIMTVLVYGENIQQISAGVAFLIFSLLSSLLVLQMLIALLCDIVAKGSESHRNAEAHGLLRQHLYQDLMKCDKTGDGKLSMEELHAVLSQPISRAVLKKLKINRLFFCELANMLYPEASSTVDVKVIMELLISCVGGNEVTVDMLSSAFGFLTNELCEMEGRLTHAFQPSPNEDGEPDLLDATTELLQEGES